MFNLGDKFGITFGDKGELKGAILTVTKICTPQEAIKEGTLEPLTPEQEFDAIEEHPQVAEVIEDAPASEQDLKDLEYYLRTMQIWSDDREQRNEFVIPWIRKCFGLASVTPAAMIKSSKLTRQFIEFLKGIAIQNAKIPK